MSKRRASDISKAGKLNADQLENPIDQTPLTSESSLANDALLDGLSADSRALLTSPVVSDLPEELPVCSSRRWLVHPAAVLVGIGSGWHLYGTTMMLTSIINPLPTMTAMFAAVVVLSAAGGPWFPERVVRIVTWLHRSRQVRPLGYLETGSTWMLRAIRHADASLGWLALAMLAAAAGIMALMTTFGLVSFAEMHRSALVNFFWTNLTLALFEWGVVAFLIGGVWMLIGLILGMLPAVTRHEGYTHRDPPGILAGGIIGLAIAWFSQVMMADYGLSGEQIALAGALPLFALAGIAARISQSASDAPEQWKEAESTAPEIQAEGEGLIWVGFVVWAVATTWIVGGWLTTASRIVGDREIDLLAGEFLLVLGVSVALGSLYARHQHQSASGCGMSAWFAGTVTALATTLIAFRPESAAVVRWTMVLLGVSCGYSLHYCQRAWLARCGSQALGFALASVALLVGLGAGMIVVQWWALPTFGAIGTMCIAALLLIAFGGLVQIYEHDRPLRTRHQRLALVFATLAGVIIVFPADVRRWAAVEKRYLAARDVVVDLSWLRIAERPPAMRMFLIGVDPDDLTAGNDAPSASIDLLPVAWKDVRAGTIPDDWKRMHILPADAFRTIRMIRKQYDLIYQLNYPRSEASRSAEYSLEWFQRLVARTSHGGELYIDVPLEGMTPRAIAIIAGTFEQAVGKPSYWMVLNDHATPMFRMKGMPTIESTSDASELASWTPIETLRTQFGQLRLHRLNRDRLTMALADTPIMTIEEIKDWLEQQRIADLTLFH